MKQLEARKTSNAAPKGGVHEKDEGKPEIEGFTLIAYSECGPAQENSEVKSNGRSIGAPVLGSNLGTSRDAYELQPDDDPAEESGDVE